MYHLELIFLNHVVPYEEVSNLDMLGFLVVLYVVQQVNCALIVAIERRDKGVVVVSLPQISR